jgi:TonB family protein
MLEILRSEDRLLWRLVLVSLMGHVLFFLVLVGLNIARPSYRRIMPLRTVRLYSVTKPQTLATKVQQPPPAVQATPKPEATPKPKPTPKKVIEKPKNTPTPSPPKPKQVAKATPRPTAGPRPTPATTPRPRSTPVSTPRPAVQPVATPVRPAPVEQPRPVAFEQVDLPDFYFQSALAKIESNFRVPRNLKNLPMITKVEFTVLRDGTISNIRILKSSGNAQLDEIAARTLELTGTLGPLPDTIQRNYVNLSVTFDFSIAQ